MQRLLPCAHIAEPCHVMTMMMQNSSHGVHDEAGIPGGTATVSIVHRRPVQSLSERSPTHLERGMRLRGRAGGAILSGLRRSKARRQA